MFKSLSLFFLFVLPAKTIFANGDADTVLNRHAYFLINTSGVNDKSTNAIIGSFDMAAGRWKNLDYGNTKRGDWPVWDHIRNIRYLAVSWKNPQSTFYRSQEVLEIIKAALNDWFHHKYKNPNWWHNEIGIPQVMRDIVVLLRNDLDRKTFAQCLEIVKQYRIKGTGANLIWSADIGLFYGLLTADMPLVDSAKNLIEKEIKITREEGLQPDFSFHQHGARLQMFHYGGAFLLDNIRLAWELRNTRWQYDADKVNLLNDMLLDGWQWMARGINTVPETIDRAATRQDALHSADIRKYIPLFIELSPTRKEDFLILLRSQQHNKQYVTGHKYFPYSDLTSFHQKEFSFFLKTISSRTLTTESINGENIQGKLLNSGETYFIRTGQEYFNLMPVWDWKKLPGITSFAGAEKIERDDFSGSVSDGQSGITVMNYKMIGSENQSISCKKFWLINKNFMICLLAGIINNSGKQAYTILDQSRLHTNIFTDKGVLAKTDSIKFYNYAQHNNFTYMPLYKRKIHVSFGSRSGSWHDINISYSDEIVNDKIFMPYILHHHKDHAAGYVVLYSNDNDKISRFIKNPPLKVLYNTPVCQAVSISNDVYAAFYQPGSILYKRKKIAVNKPCLILIQDDKFYLSDPSHKGILLNVGVNNKQYKVQLPPDGTTVMQKL